MMETAAGRVNLRCHAHIGQQQGRCPSAAFFKENAASPREYLGTEDGESRRVCLKIGSGLLAFQKRHFEHLAVHHRAVAEIVALAKAFAMVGGDDEMRAFRCL